MRIGPQTLGIGGVQVGGLDEPPAYSSSLWHEGAGFNHCLAVCAIYIPCTICPHGPRSKRT